MTRALAARARCTCLLARTAPPPRGRSARARPGPRRRLLEGTPPSATARPRVQPSAADGQPACARFAAAPPQRRQNQTHRGTAFIARSAAERRLNASGARAAVWIGPYFRSLLPFLCALVCTRLGRAEWSHGVFTRRRAYTATGAGATRTPPRSFPRPFSSARSR